MAAARPEAWSRERVVRPHGRFAPVGRQGPAAFSRILVGLTADPDAGAALDLAGRLAQRDGARLTIAAATAPHVALAWSPLGADAWLALEDELTTRLRRFVQALPPDVGVTHSVTPGPLAPALARAMRGGPFDGLVLAPSAMHRRAVRRVARRSAIPVVPGPVARV